MAETERFDSNGNKIDNSSEKKKGNKLWIVVVALFVIYIALNSCLIVCHEDEYKLIRQFGRVDRTITDAGLYVKIPFIESVDTVPKKVLLYDLPVSDVITSDKKTMIVDCYVLWRVTDPLKFAHSAYALNVFEPLLSCPIAISPDATTVPVYNLISELYFHL